MELNITKKSKIDDASCIRNSTNNGPNDFLYLGTEAFCKVKNFFDKSQNTSECIRKITDEYLCNLRENFTQTEESKAQKIIQEGLDAQKALTDQLDSKDLKNVLMVLKSPEGVFHTVKIPNSFNEKQKIEIIVGGKKLTLETDKLSNGYNTEYIINGGGTHRRQIAVLFPVINKEWENIKIQIESLLTKQKEINIEKIKDESKIKRYKSILAIEKNKLKKNPKDKKQDEKVKKLEKEIYENGNDLKDFSEKLLELGKEIEEKNILLSKKQKVVDFPYSPYHRDFDTIGVRSHGFNYLNKKTKEGLEYMEGIKSKVRGEKKLSINEAFSHDIATVLNIIERMDYQIYFDYTKKGSPLKDDKTLKSIMEPQINKALTTIGLNQNGAFNWQRSKAGALGIGQIMPKTYKDFLSEYPKIFPEKYDFENGAKDHTTTFRLQQLHFNDEGGAMPDWIKNNWSKLMSNEKAKIGIYGLLAAGYNGTMKRVVKEAELGEKFDIELLDPEKLIKKLEKNRETQTYVIKFLYTREYLKRNYKDFGK